MAEAARTLTENGQSATEPVTTIDLDLSGITTTEPAGDSPPPQEPDPRDTELQTLRQQNERLRQQVSGSSSEARRLAEETRLNNERIARLEGALQARQPQPQEPAAPQPIQMRGRLKSALQKWVNGDESDLDAVEQDFERLAQIQRPTAPVAEPVKPADIQALIRQELSTLGTGEVVRSSVRTVHPEMADSSSPVYAAVYNTYDAYANDQTNQVMYPKDPRFEVNIYSPDGAEMKTVDARIIRQLAGDVKLQLGTRAQQQGAVGQTQGGRGTTTTRQGQAQVEAIDLLTQQERDEIFSMQQQKAWPSAWPKDIKAAARFIYDGLSAVEKAKRVADYKQSMRSLA